MKTSTEIWAMSFLFSIIALITLEIQMPEGWLSSTQFFRLSIIFMTTYTMALAWHCMEKYLDEGEK